VTKRCVLGLLCIVLLTGSLFALDIDIKKLASKLDPEIQKMMQEGKVASATMALISGKDVIWTGAYGFSNLWAKTKAVPNTVYLIGSTFKTMSTYALLQLMEKGSFDLDDRVNDYLDEFQIKGEDPAQPVTFRHLLTHTSGLPAAFGSHPVWGHTVPLPLKDYLETSLKLVNPPMIKLIYSNLAYTLIAYLVEKFSGEPYREYMQKNIFDPIGLIDTAFEPRPDMEERLAIPYRFNEKLETQAPVIKQKADVWPAGIVYGTIMDQAKWLIVNLNGGTLNGHRLISEETHKEIMTRQYDKFTGPISAGWLNETTGLGLTWWMSERNNDTLFAHSGSVTGYTAFLVGNLDKKIGFAVLTNGTRAHSFLFKLAVKALDILEGLL
jgi:CubicO group peptidase (beta-lactamase class C family)